MAHFPAAEHFENALDQARAKNWDRLLAVREEVLKALEPLRAAKTISANLQARVRLAATGELAALLQRYATQLPAFFIVSQVEIASGEIEGASLAPGIEGLRIRAERALGKKCERCWNYSTHVGESSDYPTLCERCLAAIQEIERDRLGRTGGATS
jgi:isoleucyl-tRNA synthetase